MNTFSTFLLIILVVQYSIFLFCIIRQFEQLRDRRKLLVIFGVSSLILGLLGNIFLSNVSQISSYSTYESLFACAALSLLAFFISSADASQHKAKTRVLWKLPLLGVFTMFLTKSIAEWLVPAFLLFGILFALFFLYRAKTFHRPAFRSYVTFVVFCILSVAFNFKWNITSGLLLVAGNLFLFQTLNFYLVKIYVSERLKVEAC